MTLTSASWSEKYISLLTFLRSRINLNHEKNLISTYIYPSYHFFLSIQKFRETRDFSIFLQKLILFLINMFQNVMIYCIMSQCSEAPRVSSQTENFFELTKSKIVKNVQNTCQQKLVFFITSSISELFITTLI